MKLLKILTIVSLSFIRLSIAHGDEPDSSSYGDVQTSDLNKSNPLLTIKIPDKISGASIDKQKLRIKLYNSSDKPLAIVEQNIFADFAFEVKGVDGSILPENLKGKGMKQNREAWIHTPITLEPGQFTTYDVNLKRFYDLQPGQTYTVQVFRYARFGDGPIVKISSNTLELVIPFKSDK